MAAAATALFGPAIWPAFIASLEPTRAIVLEQGNTGFHKIQSVFAAVRLWGGPVPLAHALQGIVIAGLAILLVVVWRGRASHDLKAAALALACLLATPYSLDYDLIVVAVALAFLVRHAGTHGLAPWQGAAMTLAFFAPILSRPAADLIGLPLGVLSLAALLAITVALAREGSAPVPARA
jgi:alpha-1,2-mannosyltransferase